MPGPNRELCNSVCNKHCINPERCYRNGTEANSATVLNGALLTLDTRDNSTRLIDTNRELATLLAALFDVRPDSTDEQFIRSGKRFAKKLEGTLQEHGLLALQARLDRLELGTLTPTDFEVCKQLGLDPRKF